VFHAVEDHHFSCGTRVQAAVGPPGVREVIVCGLVGDPFGNRPGRGVQGPGEYQQVPCPVAVGQQIVARSQGHHGGDPGTAVREPDRGVGAPRVTHQRDPPVTDPPGISDDGVQRGLQLPRAGRTVVRRWQRPVVRSVSG
jgi:hypothetical protein